jgi:hypothetical protein
MLKFLDLCKLGGFLGGCGAWNMRAALVRVWQHVVYYQLVAAPGLRGAMSSGCWGFNAKRLEQVRHPNISYVRRAACIAPLVKFL